MSSIPVLITQHEAGAPPGTVLEALIDAGLTVDVREPFAGEALPEPRRIDDFSGLVVLGGAMNVDEEGRFPFLAEERVLLAEALRRDVPILGICLGAQQLAAAIGGEVFTRPEPEVGWLPVDVVVTSDPLFAGVENPFHAFQWHASRSPSPTRPWSWLRAPTASACRPSPPRPGLGVSSSTPRSPRRCCTTGSRATARACGGVRRGCSRVFSRRLGRSRASRGACAERS
jgi:GMP synthase-like glutamine amidotransferase